MEKLRKVNPKTFVICRIVLNILYLDFGYLESTKITINRKQMFLVRQTYHL